MKLCRGFKVLLCTAPIPWKKLPQDPKIASNIITFCSQGQGKEVYLHVNTRQQRKLTYELTVFSLDRKKGIPWQMLVMSPRALLKPLQYHGNKSSLEPGQNIPTQQWNCARLVAPQGRKREKRAKSKRYMVSTHSLGSWLPSQLKFPCSFAPVSSIPWFLPLPIPDLPTSMPPWSPNDLLQSLARITGLVQKATSGPEFLGTSQESQ